MTRKKTSAPRRAMRSAQQGVVLIIALVVLVVMMLAGLLMLRSAGTGVEVAGNIGFKQNATSVGDLGIEAGRAFLMGFLNDAVPLDTDRPADAYFATWDENFAPIQFDWDGAKEAMANDGTGNRVRYIIHRLCSLPGATTGATQKCAIPATGGALGTGGGGGSGPGFSGLVGQAYYRITSRVDGPRGTVSYVQVIMF